MILICLFSSVSCAIALDTAVRDKTIKEGDFVCIPVFGVDPDYQRKDIAKILFTEITNNLKKVGVDTIITFVTRRDWILLKFFNSMGFQKGDMINLEVDI
ncbi:MAG: GNAT family N-acetyltransferase [Deltaproteobacteria bacterium]|nr:GNAT family N-acetyltransferase [Deltaproteobacteria bacterium]